jgi:SAM-dependent methyltransferase
LLADADIEHAAAEAARRSEYRETGRLSELADRDELAFRDVHEPYSDPAQDVPAWIQRKSLLRRLDDALAGLEIEPAGTVVELGAGSCWLCGALARRPEVERAIGIEFSRRRLVELAPYALAYVGAPAEKVERVLADFYDHGLPDGCADLVVCDAAFHHAADPERLCRVAFDLLRPGGDFFLHREPALTPIRRTRKAELEDQFGDFENEFMWWTYMRFLREAGFEPRKAPATHGYTSLRDRLVMRRPFSWLNGVVWANFSYAGRKPLS